MKKCRVCGFPKDATEFPFKNKALGLRQSRCKTCVREYGKRHYRANKAPYIARAAAQHEHQELELRKKITKYLSNQACIDCGEDDPIVLDFDHRDQQAKRLTICAMIQRRWSWSTILAEIAKCDVRCANCHRRRTAKQLGFYKLKLL